MVAALVARQPLAGGFNPVWGWRGTVTAGRCRTYGAGGFCWFGILQICRTSGARAGAQGSCAKFAFLHPRQIRGSRELP